MIHITLPDDSKHRLVFYLAMEEYIANNINEIAPPDEEGRHEAFFIWQVDPTVIFGRNQVMEAEVNIDYCRERGIKLFRRKSGGGCVYSDSGNIMLSYISDRTDVSSTFDLFLDRLANCLSALGPQSERSGRNDILVAGLKVSGNAFFKRPNSSIVHGTLLFDSDFEEMERAISPSHLKMANKGISSARQRVINFKEALLRYGNDKAAGMEDITCFKRYLVEYFTSGKGERMLSPEELRSIEEIEKTYLDPDFLLGKNHLWSEIYRGRIEGVGEMEIDLQMENDLIVECRLRGDFFPLKDGLDAYLTSILKGKRNDDNDAGASLEASEPGEYVLNLTGKALRILCFGKTT